MVVVEVAVTELVPVVVDEAVILELVVVLTAVSGTADTSSMLTSSPLQEDRDEDCWEALRAASRVGGSDRSSGGGGGGGGAHAPGSETALFSALLLGEWFTGSEFL